MPDRDTLDLDPAFDPDPAFDHLCADVESRTRARGAEQAIRSAGHRRLAGAGGGLVVAAALAGVLGSTLGLPGDESVPRVAAPAPDPLPEPAAFDATAFNEAANGWTRSWSEDASPVPTVPPCVPYDGTVPEPIATSTREFRVGTRTGARHTVNRFDTAELARDSLLAQSFAHSCQAEVTDLPGEIWSGGESVNYAITTSRQTYHEFMLVHETEVAVLRVAGAGKLPEEAREQVVLALLADLRT